MTFIDSPLLVAACPMLARPDTVEDLCRVPDKVLLPLLRVSGSIAGAEDAVAKATGLVVTAAPVGGSGVLIAAVVPDNRNTDQSSC